MIGRKRKMREREIRKQSLISLVVAVGHRKEVLWINEDKIKAEKEGVAFTLH